LTRLQRDAKEEGTEIDRNKNNLGLCYIGKKNYPTLIVSPYPGGKSINWTKEINLLYISGISLSLSHLHS
jgi:hypothetical protein